MMVVYQVKYPDVEKTIMLFLSHDVTGYRRSPRNHPIFMDILVSQCLGLLHLGGISLQIRCHNRLTRCHMYILQIRCHNFQVRCHSPLRTSICHRPADNAIRTAPIHQASVTKLKLVLHTGIHTLNHHQVLIIHSIAPTGHLSGRWNLVANCYTNH